MRRNYLFAALLSFAIALLAAFVLSANAQEWLTANQITITWDTVTTLENEAPMPESSVVEYRLWLVNADTDPDKLKPIQLPGEGPDTTYVITMNTEGRFFVGLQTLRKAQNGSLLGESNIAWTDNPDTASGGATFGLRYYVPPASPTGAAPLN